LGEFPTEPVTREAYPYPPQVRARRTSHDCRPAQGRAIAVQGQYLQRCSSNCVVLQRCSFVVVYFLQLYLGRLWWWRRGSGGKHPANDRKNLGEPHGYSSKNGSVGASTTGCSATWDGEAVPVAPVPPRVEVPFVAPMPPPPPVLIAEEPVMQVEKFIRVQPPTYSGGPNPDTAKHWVHEIERVRVRRTSHDRRPAQDCAIAVQGQYLQRCSSSCAVLQQCSFVVVYFLQLYL
ncbi:hypothetical protein Taro_006415, partial [Colocasia esculenta]|nr:hypothetical protein [Colocasia esculenta]